MIINASKLKELGMGYKTRFNKAMAESPAAKKLEGFKFLFMEEKSTGAGEKYGFVVDAGSWREWVGEREWQNLKVETIDVINKHFEKSYALLATDIEDDKQNMLLPAVTSAGANWPTQKLRLIFDVINDNPKIYDGVALFGSHKYGKYTVNNLGTAALAAAAYDAAVQLMAGWKGANGDFLAVQPTHLMVAPNLRAAAFAIVGTEKLADGTTNPNYKHTKIVVCPWMKAGEWCLVDGSQGMKPVMLQSRKEPKPKMTEDPAKVEETGKAVFMADGRAAAAGTVPHLIYKSTGTA